MVIWVLCHYAVDECPREIVLGIRLILDSLGDNLCIKMIVQAVVQMALYREMLVHVSMMTTRWDWMASDQARALAATTT